MNSQGSTRELWCMTLIFICQLFNINTVKVSPTIINSVLAKKKYYETYNLRYCCFVIIYRKSFDFIENNR